MPVLARVYHFDAQKLDADIQQEQELSDGEFTTGQVSASANPSRRGPDHGKLRIRRPNNTPYSKLRNPGHRLHFSRRRIRTNAPEFPPVSTQSPVTISLDMSSGTNPLIHLDHH